MIMTAVESSVFCKTCEYELTGTLENRCPECARPFDPGTPETYEVMPGHRRRKRQYLVATAFALLVIVMLFEGIRRYEPWLTYIAVLIGGPGLIALFLGIHLRRSTPKPLLTLLAVAPSALLLGLFYSLAVHMHQTLGGWPASIGNNGFSSSLNIHDGVTSWYFGLTLLLNLTLMPLLMLISTGLRQTRGALYYLGMNAVVFCVANGAMNLAPAPFLNWWWD